MTNTEKEKPVKLGGMQAHTRDLFNKGIGSEGTCSTAATTAAKTVTLGTTFELVSKATILVKFTNAISVANATLAVTHTDLDGNTVVENAKPIYYQGAALEAGLVKAGSILILRYDGTSYNIVGDLNTDTTYSTMGASGSTHAGGLVPDTPSTAGTTKFLCEDGSWKEPSGSIPSQTGNNGKFLTTNGSTASWADIPSDNTKTDKLPMTGAGAATENNFMAIDANGNIKDSGKNENSFLTQHQSIKTINGASIVGTGNVNLQTPLTFDSTPTANSDNPVKSGGVKTYVDNGLSEKVSKSNTAGLLKNDGTVDTKTYLSDIEKRIVYFQPGWTDNWTKVEVLGNTNPLFYLECHGYFHTKYLNLSLFFSIRDSFIKNVHLNTADGKYMVSNQGNVIIYKESNTVFYIYCGYNTNAMMLLYNNNSAMTLTHNFYPAPSTSGLTKIFELDDYNGMDDF